MSHIKKIFTYVVAASLLGTGCKDLLVPNIQNNRQLDPNAYLPSDARFPYGVLLNAYTRIPTNSWTFSDVATDDAVSNDQNNAFLKAATGQWTAINNPLNQWTNGFAAIQYINIVLEEADKVKWASNEAKSALFNTRIKGEAYALRALHMYHLLLNHAGVGTDGKLLGVPILLLPQVATSNFNVARATFQECVAQIYKDLDKAEAMLPLDFERLTSASQIPPQFGTNLELYNEVFGDAFRGLITARIAKAIRAQTAFLAASPAYQTGGYSGSWEEAAKLTAAVINLKGGMSGFATNGLQWYSNAA
ncbi:MAG TPA: RagB/SusD family nutrient uptake outer membrane protein, partial [Phnomibacter sp.]|nr:RagB/SusD family nutrient uptake outer membrane protein [Phnomibacter sp.]